MTAAGRGEPGVVSRERRVIISPVNSFRHSDAPRRAGHDPMTFEPGLPADPRARTRTLSRTRGRMIANVDLPKLLQTAGILTRQQTRDLEARLRAREYPQDFERLAECLVRDEFLTDYQLERLVSGRGHELRIDRYVLLGELGRGAMGEVFKAKHLLMDRDVALKRIVNNLPNRDRATLRFLREIRLAARLDHPNVVRAFDADVSNDEFYLVMEYVSGLSLQDQLRRQIGMKPARVIDYVAQAARGLHHAHEQGVVHRDVKPSNLLCTESKQIKVVDFGLGVLVDDSEILTRPDVAVGTTDFMAPEQALGQDVDGRSDIYSLGCTMYYLLTGGKHFAFPGENKMTRFGKRVKEPPVPIRRVRPDLPESVERVLDRMMRLDPDDRYQDCEELARALGSLLSRRSDPGASRSGSSGQVGSPEESLSPTLARDDTMSRGRSSGAGDESQARGASSIPQRGATLTPMGKAGSGGGPGSGFEALEQLPPIAPPPIPGSGGEGAGSPWAAARAAQAGSDSGRGAGAWIIVGGGLVLAFVCGFLSHWFVSR